MAPLAAVDENMLEGEVDLCIEEAVPQVSRRRKRSPGFIP
jgi:hypothetical protein